MNLEGSRQYRGELASLPFSLEGGGITRRSDAARGAGSTPWLPAVRLVLGLLAADWVFPRIRRGAVRGPPSTPPRRVLP
jgi:hypothetical protein